MLCLLVVLLHSSFRPSDKISCVGAHALLKSTQSPDPLLCNRMRAVPAAFNNFLSFFSSFRVLLGIFLIIYGSVEAIFMFFEGRVWVIFLSLFSSFFDSFNLFFFFDFLLIFLFFAVFG